MISKEVISTMYRKYKRRPKSPDYLDFALLFDHVAELHNISVDLEHDELVIRSIDPASPFHRLPLSRIHAIVPFEEWIAVVLPAAIIFLSKKSSQVQIHLKDTGPSLLDRIHMLGHKIKDE